MIRKAPPQNGAFFILKYLEIKINCIIFALGIFIINCNYELN